MRFSRDNVLKVEYPKKLNFRLVFILRLPFSMKHTGQRFEGRVSQKVKLSLDFHPPVTFSMQHTGQRLEGKVSQKVLKVSLIFGRLYLENVVPYQGRGPHPERG